MNKKWLKGWPKNAEENSVREGRGKKEGRTAYRNRLKEKKSDKAKQKQILVQENEDRAYKVNFPAQKKALLHKYDNVFLLCNRAGELF